MTNPAEKYPEVLLTAEQMNRIQKEIIHFILMWSRRSSTLNLKDVPISPGGFFAHAWTRVPSVLENKSCSKGNLGGYQSAKYRWGEWNHSIAGDDVHFPICFGSWVEKFCRKLKRKTRIWKLGSEKCFVWRKKNTTSYQLSPPSSQSSWGREQLKVDCMRPYPERHPK